MSKFSTHLSILSNLVAVAQRLADDNVSSSGIEGDNNWSETKAEMELDLGRPLNDEEVTLLSLSRAFGPIPSFKNGVDPTSRLWPKGNPSGLRYDWDQLAEELIAFRDGNDNAVFVHASGLHGVYIVTLRENPEQGYLAEEGGPEAWFGDDACPSSYDMPCIGWFGPGHSWDDAEQAIRSLSGYEVDSQLVSDVAKFQLLWDQGRMEEALTYMANWHPDAFDAQLWRGVDRDEAWNRAAAALYKLHHVLSDSDEWQQVEAALEALGIE